MTIHKMLLTICAVGLVLPCAAQVGRETRPDWKLPELLASLRNKALKGMQATPAITLPAAPLGPFLFRQPAEWTISTGECSLLKSQVHGTGFAKVTVFISTNDDGTTHIDLRTDASGTAQDTAGNKYIWMYNSLGDIDTATPDALFDPALRTGDVTFTVSGPDTFQLIPAAGGGTGYSMAQFFNVDTPTTPTPGVLVKPVAGNAPAGCDPRPAGAF